MVSIVSLLAGKSVLELGAGTGLVSVILSSLCKRVITSDKDTNILDLIESNLNRNKHLKNNKCDINCMIIDWNLPEQIEFEGISGIDFIVACDVAYDPDISDSFISCLCKICLRFSEDAKRQQLKVYISSEKRIVFCYDDEKPSHPSYSYFVEALTKTLTSNLNQKSFTCSIENVCTNDLACHFEFDRPSTMELLCITIVFR